jgi:uncharacterized membrane protein YfcA
VTLWQALLLVLAGVAGGLTGSIAGLASLVSYPALLAVGLAPVTANITNTVALVFSSVGSWAGSRPELVDQGARLRRLGPVAVLGGTVGAVLLLSTPSGSFQRIVPWLVGAGSVTILLVRHPTGLIEATPKPDSQLVLLAVFVIGVYSGYFGAAAGVLMLALLLFSTSQSLARSNALKNVLMGLSNFVAAVLFVFLGSVRWSAAVPLAVGFVIGGRVGPVVVRHSPARLLRILIALAGLGLAVYLGVDAYR